LIGDAGVRPDSPDAEAEPAGTGQGHLKVRQARMATELDRRPTVAARPAQGAVVQAKAQPSDQVQHGARGGTEAGAVAGVRRDLRLQQCDVQHFPPSLPHCPGRVANLVGRAGPTDYPAPPRGFPGGSWSPRFLTPRIIEGWGASF